MLYPFTQRGKSLSGQLMTLKMTFVSLADGESHHLLCSDRPPVPGRKRLGRRKQASLKSPFANSQEVPSIGSLIVTASKRLLVMYIRTYTCTNIHFQKPLSMTYTALFVVLHYIRRVAIESLYICKFTAVNKGPNIVTHRARTASHNTTTPQTTILLNHSYRIAGLDQQLETVWSKQFSEMNTVKYYDVISL